MHTAMSTLRAAASLRRLAASTPRPPLMGIAATSTPHTSAARRTYYALGVAPEPFHPIPNKHPREMTAEEAVEHIHDGENVYIHTGAAAPYSLVTALANYGRNRAPRPLHDVGIYSMHTEGPAPYVDEDMPAGVFRTRTCFTAANMRAAVAAGRADFIPVFLSEVPHLFRRGVIPLDHALVTVSPPDDHGYCSLGVSVDCSRAAVQAASHIIAVVNPQMPRTHGDSFVHVSHIDVMVHDDRPIYTHEPAELTDVETRIGKIIAHELVEDGATLQLGIGGIPDAVLAQLTHHKDLGIHSEMLSDGILDLVEAGAVTNAHKTFHPGQVVSGFCLGSRRLYDWMHDNPGLNMLDIERVNDVFVCSKQPKMTAINSAIEVDITGQVVADSIGTRQYSGVGGQVDFIRGAGLCPDGKPIIALPATTRRGESRIVPTIKDGGGVVTTRAHVHYVVTEFGAVNLFGKGLRSRARSLISIAHPAHREALEVAARERFGPEFRAVGAV